MKKKWYRSKWVYFALILLLGVLIGADLHLLFDAINGVIDWNVFLHCSAWSLFCIVDCLLTWNKIELLDKEKK